MCRYPRVDGRTARRSLGEGGPEPPEETAEPRKWMPGTVRRMAEPDRRKPGAVRNVRRFGVVDLQTVLRKQHHFRRLGDALSATLSSPAARRRHKRTFVPRTCHKISSATKFDPSRTISQLGERPILYPLHLRRRYPRMGVRGFPYSFRKHKKYFRL